MNYRELGSTGIKVSEVGLGCEGFIGHDDELAAQMFQTAFDQGVNCMDMYHSNPELRSLVGRMLRGRREQFVLQGHLCTTWQDGQYKATRDLDEVKASFEDLMARLETTYMDVGMIHYVDSLSVWQEVLDSGIMEYARALKAAGRIRHIGMSSHNPVAALEAVKSGLIEVLMFSVNPCYDLQPGNEDINKLWAEDSYKNHLSNMDPDRQKLYETCQRMGVGITVMKAFGGGDLLSDDSPAGKALTVNQCIHYALTRPAVSTVFTGAHNQEELLAGLSYETASAEERDYAATLASFPKISWHGHCMYCGHCAPCPQGIEVANVTKFLNLAKAQKMVPETVREHYGSLEHKAGDCIQCGQCEARCPFGVAIRENMLEAERIFGL